MSQRKTVTTRQHPDQASKQPTLGGCPYWWFGLVRDLRADLRSPWRSLALRGVASLGPVRIHVESVRSRHAKIVQDPQPCGNPLHITLLHGI